MDALGEYRDRTNLAAMLGVHVRTLDRWFLERRGPPRTMIGRRVFYRIDSVKAWLRSNELPPLSR